MAINETHRTSVIKSLLPAHSTSLLDVGCGPITPAYPYADLASQVVCMDWKYNLVGEPRANVNFIEGDFTKFDFGDSLFDTIIAADVFEHVALEDERTFVDKCVSLLKPGGHLIVSVPHDGTFAFLDPYKVKPALHRLLWRAGLYSRLHNGACDIRKGHKHYRAQELFDAFSPLQPAKVEYFGYFFDPLLSWASAVSRRIGRFPGYDRLEKACENELKRDYGSLSFNIALKFNKT